MEPTDGFIPYHRESYTEEETLKRATEHYQWMDERRTVREFSDRPIAKEVVEQLIMSASTAPSGAHKQPWVFCAVGDPAIKNQIRLAAEEEEYTNYHGRMSEDWLDDLKPFGTDHHKPFLETAPWLIVVFRKSYDLEDGRKKTNYYVQESVGLATGFLLEAIHHAGLVALTHTPSPMNFLCEVLDRPKNEKPFLLIPIGYPKDGTMVPDIKRKPADEVIVWY